MADKLTVKELQREINKERWDKDNVSVVVKDSKGMVFTIIGFKAEANALVLEARGELEVTSTNKA